MLRHVYFHYVVLSGSQIYTIVFLQTLKFFLNQNCSSQSSDRPQITDSTFYGQFLKHAHIKKPLVTPTFYKAQ